jgi:universal stress protein A
MSTTDAPRRVREIAVATDFSETAESAAAVAREYARAFGARVHLLHVTWAGEEQPRRRLTEMAADFGPEVGVVTALEFGSPAAHIVDYARRHGIDLIVLGTHGRTGISRALVGSVAERVVRTAPCPVLTVSRAVEPAVASETEATAPALPHCLICVTPSEDLICPPCRARVRGEALERKQREERAGRQ